MNFQIQITNGATDEDVKEWIRVLRVIQRIRNLMLGKQMELILQRGGCGQLALLLREIFGGTILIRGDKQHVAFSLDGVAFDVKGQITPDKLHTEKWRPATEDDLGESLMAGADLTTILNRKDTRSLKRLFERSKRK
jgi:hypothetical protein